MEVLAVALMRVNVARTSGSVWGTARDGGSRRCHDVLRSPAHHEALDRRRGHRVGAPLEAEDSVTVLDAPIDQLRVPSQAGRAAAMNDRLPCPYVSVVGH